MQPSLSNQLYVYSASAGSGKTYTIACEYISMMLKAENNATYRNILAVTFTNKACDEMKSRIVLNLFQISNVDKISGNMLAEVNDIIKTIEKKTNLGRNEIISRSRRFFSQIVHDYSFFSVYTIDSFFQKIVRNLTYELGMQQNYELELDTSLVISQLVDDIMLRAETDADLNRYISSMIEDNINLDKKWSPKVAIKNFISQAVANDFNGLNCDINKYEEKIDGIISDFCVKFKNNIDGIGGLIKKHNLTKADFYGGYANYYYYEKFSKYDLGSPNFRRELFDKYPGEKFKDEKWFKKGSPNLHLVQEFSTYIDNIRCLKYNDFCTAFVVKKNMNLIRLLGKATEILHENLNRDSIFLLSDVPSMLSRIINMSSDSSGNVSVMPFIFESVGTKYCNFMIDEFQDTSNKQWNIFHTMLQDALSQGNDSIVVGDIKQSIYSWRGGDWRILSDLSEKKILSDYSKKEPLKDNYRTARNIVEFNNDFFYSEYNKKLSLFGNTAPDSNDKSFENLYNDVWQGVKKEKDSEIKVKLYNGPYSISDDIPKARIFNDMLAEIEDLQLNHHVQPQNITILVRKKSEARFIANSFLAISDENRKEGVRYDVVSDEALYIVSSRAVRIILAYMRYILNNKDEISLAEASYLYFLEKNNLENSFEYNRRVKTESFLADLGHVDGLSEKQLFEIVDDVVNRLNLNAKEKNAKFLAALSGIVRNFTDIQSFLDYWGNSAAEEKNKEDYNAAESIYSNIAVGIIVLYLRYVLDNDDANALDEASELYFLLKNDLECGFDFNRNAMVDSFLADLLPDESLSEKQSFEIVEIMINRLHLNAREKNVPFLIAFRNVVHDFSEKSTDLQAFMDYWDERGSSETLKIPESQNAIRIITVHTSKGLEADYIFIPFCNWEFIATGLGQEYLFVDDPIDGGNFRIPVESTAALGKTAMANVYNDSRYGKTIESYNLLYVAFTRAKYGLFVSAFKEDANRVSCLLADYFSDESMQEDIVEPVTKKVLKKRGDDWTCEQLEIGSDLISLKIYTRGSLPGSNVVNAGSGSNFITEYSVCEQPSIGILHHIYEDIEGDMSARIRGTKYHAIFEQIITKDDVESSVSLLLDNGEIDGQTAENLVSEFNKVLIDENVSRWYDGSCEVYNEFNIIDPNSTSDKLKRPDRVMIFPDEVVILDYKFGKEENIKRYADQVRYYAKLISQMKGFAGKRISAYIWYYFRSELVKVEMSGETSVTKITA